MFLFQTTYFFGCALALSACVWMNFGRDSAFGIYEIYAVAVVIGIAGSTLLIISLSLTSDMIANSTVCIFFLSMNVIRY